MQYTRMHYSRMRTVHCSSHLLGGVCVCVEGVSAYWVVSAQGGLLREKSGQVGGVCPGGGCLPSPSGGGGLSA